VSPPARSSQLSCSDPELPKVTMIQPVVARFTRTLLTVFLALLGASPQFLLSSRLLSGPLLPPLPFPSKHLSVNPAWTELWYIGFAFRSENHSMRVCSDAAPHEPGEIGQHPRSTAQWALAYFRVEQVLWSEWHEDGGPRRSPAAIEGVRHSVGGPMEGDDGVITGEPRDAFRGQQNRPPMPVKDPDNAFKHALNTPQPQRTADENFRPKLYDVLF
jgi:hypothetical protein